MATDWQSVFEGQRAQTAALGPNPFIDAPKTMYEQWTSLLQKPRVLKAKDLPQVVHGDFQLRHANTLEAGLKSFVCFFENLPAGNSSKKQMKERQSLGSRQSRNLVCFENPDHSFSLSVLEIATPNQAEA